MTAEILLSLEDIGIKFETYGPPNRVVENLSLTVGRGEILGLVGESGCGKSVLARSVSRLLPSPPARVSGRVVFQGQEVPNDPKRLRALRGRSISMIFQEPMTSLNPVFTVGRQMGEVVRLHTGLNRPAAKKHCLELLAAVKMPDPETVFAKYPHELSGGQRQRVMIALALSCGPALLIADEPTTALDVTVQSQVLNLLNDLTRARGVSTLFITHDLGVVAQLCDRVAVMYAGQLMEVAPVAELFAAPAHPYTRGLLAAIPTIADPRASLPSIPGQVPDLTDPPAGCRFHPRCGRRLDICGREAPRLSAGAAGGEHQVACHNPDPAPNPARAMRPSEAEATTAAAGRDRARAETPIIRLEGVRKTFSVAGGLFKRKGRLKAVDQVSLEIAAGETLGLVGESGCGKTTVGNLILRLWSPEAGRIFFKGRDLADLTRQKDSAPELAKIQAVFQDPQSSLDPRLTVERIVGDPLRPYWKLDRAQRRERALEILGEVGLGPEHLARYPHEFSGGQRQRIGLARALVVRPELIVCDEPTSALDVSVQAQILRLIKDLQARYGYAYLFISHNLAVVRYVASHVAVMYQGRIVEQGPTAQVLADPQHDYTRELLAAVPGSNLPPSRSSL